MMLNNKGQTLVLFVLILPIIIFIMLLVIDVSNMFITKQELNNINKIVLNYGLDIIEEENIDSKLEELINKNISVNEHTVKIENGTIEINLKKNIQGIVTKKKIYEVKSTYKGYIEEDKKVINRVI